MTMEQILGIVGMVAVVVVAYIIISMADKAKAKAGADSTEKRQLLQVVKDALENGEDYQVLYACYNQASGPHITHYAYALAFRPQYQNELWVMPLNVQKDQLQLTAKVLINEDNVTGAKGNALTIKFQGPGPASVCNTVNNLLMDKNGLVLEVAASNIKSRQASSLCPVNIQQKEAWALWEPFAKAFVERYKK